MGDSSNWLFGLVDVRGPNSCKTTGWADTPADRNSLDGGNGPGFGVTALLGGLVTPWWLPPSVACEVQHRTTDAFLAAERFAGTQLGRGRDKFLDVLPGILPPTAARYAAFDMGSGVGVLESLVDIVYGTIEGIRAIPKLTRMMLLAVNYKMRTARTHREVGVAAGLEGALAVMPGLRIFALRATPEEEKQAYEQVRAIKREVQAIVGEGWDLTQEGARDAQELWVFIWNSPQGAMRDGKKLGREGLAEARRILSEAEKTVNEPDLHKQYANGERYGKVVGETVLNILLIISMVGDIAEVARAVGSGAKVGADLAKEAAELARLERATQGTTRLASAIRGLRTALEEWRAARAAARVTAEMEAKLLADAKKLEKLSTDVGKTVEKQAGGLSREAGAVEKAKAKGKTPGGGATPAEESERQLPAKAVNDGSAAEPEPEAGSIRNVNPKKGKRNCANCVIATDATLRGNPASALPGEPTNLSVLERRFNSSFKPATLTEIETSLLKGGNGATGVVFGYPPAGSDIGHVFNAVNQNGVIRLLDGQVGTLADTTPYPRFLFMPLKPIGAP